MANGDFRDKVNTKRTEAQAKYYENSDEAWAQVKDFFTDPAHWIVALIAVLLITAGIFTVKFVSAVRAPELPTGENGVVTLGDGSEELPVTIGDGQDEIDDSNTVEPMLTGARKEGCYTFLLFGEDKISKSTDTIMVVSYDVKNQKLNLMSIPRDTMVNVSWDIKKINSVYSISGVKGLRKHIGKLIGFVPDYYVRIDLNAFIEVVNLLGGVEFDVPVPMHYHDPAQGLSIDLEPGLQLLNGEQAMGLVRFRKSDRGASGKVSGYDDTGRVQTQQAFLRVMFKKCLEVKNWTKITSYVEIFEKNVESDLTLGNMLWFARQAMDLKAEDFNTCTIPCNFYASAWSRSTGSMQSYVTLYGRQVVELVNESFNPYLSRVTLANLDIMSINSDGSVSSSTGYVADSRAAVPVVREVPKDSEESEEPEENNEENSVTGEKEEESGSSAQENAAGSAGEGSTTGGQETESSTQENSTGSSSQGSGAAGQAHAAQEQPTPDETEAQGAGTADTMQTHEPEANAQEQDPQESNTPAQSEQSGDTQTGTQQESVPETAPAIIVPPEPAQEQTPINTTPAETGD